MVTLGSGDLEKWSTAAISVAIVYVKASLCQSLRSVKASVYKSFKLLCKFSIAICRTCRAMVVRTKFFWEVYCVCMVVQSGTREQ